MAKIKVEKDAMQEIHGTLEEVRAIETLEYHNKNHLAFDNNKRSIHKIALLNDAIDTVEAYIKRQTFF